MTGRRLSYAPGMRPRALWLLALAPLACVASSKVNFADGQCLIDGVPATLAQVETHQAAITQHILSRAPILTGIAVAAVAIAGGGYIQRILTILAARRAAAQSLGDRVRLRMERYRAHPVRYFLLLGGVLSLLIAAGAAYVSLDADKRASERSLATLQFCHLALRSANEQRVLGEQRENLAAIQTSEHDIRALVDKLPPAEQEKAREIVDQLSTSLGQQRTAVAQLAQRADVNAKQVAVEVEKGLSKLDGDMGDLRTVPVALGKLSTDLVGLGARTDTVGGEVEACNAKVDSLGKSLDALGKQLADLAARPAPTCTCTVAAPTPPPPPAAKPEAAPVKDAGATPG